MSVPEKKIVRFHFLDGLRGYAISLTLFAHAFTANVDKLFDYLKLPSVSRFFPSFTASGLDLFFVLSGMVIIRPYIRKQRKFEVVEYVKRRIKRIYPPYFFALIFASFVVWFINQYPTWYNTRGMRVKFSWLETFKQLLVVNVNGVYYNLAWWSLGIEIVFYALVPLIIFLFPKKNKVSMVKVYIIITLSIFTSVMMHYFFTDHLAFIYSMSYNVLNVGKFLDFPVCFLMGVFLASRDFEVRDAWIFMVTGVVLVLSFAFNIQAIEPHYWLLVQSGYGLFYAGIITLAFNNRSFNNFWSHPFMVWLGERSFSLYLVHFSVFYLVDNIVSHFTGERNALYAILTRSIGIPLSLLMSIILFELVERKFAKGLTTADITWPWQIGRANIGQDRIHKNEA